MSLKHACTKLDVHSLMKPPSGYSSPMKIAEVFWGLLGKELRMERRRPG
jgi:hypothetical protein